VCVLPTQIQPVQRIPRYGLLLRELIKYTPATLDEGLEVLTELQAEIDDHCAFINREATLDDSRAKVGSIHNRFRPEDIDEQASRGNFRPRETIDGVVALPNSGLVQPMRRVVVSETARDALEGEILLVVFNDFIMRAKKRRDGCLIFCAKMDFSVPLQCSPMRGSGCKIIGQARYAHGLDPKEEWVVEFSNDSQRDAFDTQLSQAIAAFGS
jgi:hypothetical protein